MMFVCGNKEPCSRGCSHVQCARRCGERCAREPCTQPCSKTLACRHRCRGLCGERCPDVCNICRPDDFPKDFLGDEFDDDALFIVLEDCGHVMEFENMENLMKGDNNVISTRACPYCRKPIINTHRYKDLVNRMFATKINPVKERVYGNEKTILARKKDFTDTVANFQTKCGGIYEDKMYSDWKKAYQKMILVAKSKKKCSLLQLEMYFVYLNVLEFLSDIHKKYIEARLVKLQENLIEQISMICKVLISTVHKISKQQQVDIGNEIKRTNAIVQLSKIISHPAYLTIKSNPKVIEADNAANAIILGFKIYNPKEALKVLNDLQGAIKVSGIVTKEERDLIIKAIGAKAGSWFTCPNGHFYNIGECGGAMEEGRCVECKEKVGGTRHQLLSTNRLARDFDGSRFAAYSEEANNLANFNLDDVL